MKSVIPCLAVLLLSGCMVIETAPPGGEAPQIGGQADAVGGGIVGGPTCETAEDPGTLGASGHLYEDVDLTDLSRWSMGLAGDDHPIPGRQVRLLWAGGSLSAETCEDGSYSFPNLEEGLYLVSPSLSQDELCASRNCNDGIVAALEGGELSLVTMGDSVPVIGPAPLFPLRLTELLQQMGPVNSRNVAVGGSTAAQWQPQSMYFESRLMPELPSADVVIISLGGNDLLAALNDPALLEDLDAAVVAAEELVVEITDMVMNIVDAIHAVNPDITVIYCLYPNYGQATETSPWDLLAMFVGEEAVYGVLSKARASIPLRRRFMVADMFGALEGEPLDDLLRDQLHFNDEGQTRYAEAIFQTMGGVLVGESPLGDLEGVTPLGLIQSYGLAP